MKIIVIWLYTLIDFYFIMSNFLKFYSWNDLDVKFYKNVTKSDKNIK